MGNTYGQSAKYDLYWLSFKEWGSNQIRMDLIGTIDASIVRQKKIHTEAETKLWIGRMALAVGNYR